MSAQDPAPQAQEADVFEAFAVRWYGVESKRMMSGLVREWFGSMVSAMRMIAKHPCGSIQAGFAVPGDHHCGECAWCIAKEEVEALDARAEGKP